MNTGVAAARPRVGLAWAAVAIGLAATSIAALLVDVFGVASMGTVVRWVTAPALVALAVMGWHPRVSPELRRRIQVGAFAGLVGTFGYDLVRVPFSVIGMRVFAPIDSYGLFIAGGAMATPWTNAVGWLFHLSNGVTFGVMYGVAAARRSWWWGLAWGMALETAVLVTPFRARYALAGQVSVIAVSYFAHLAFGAPVGRMVARLDHWDAELHTATRRPVAVALLLTVLALLLWQEPWERSDRQRQAEAAAMPGRPAVVVTPSERFVPEWVRVGEGECVTVVNPLGETFRTSFGVVGADRSSLLCFAEEGAHRVRLSGRAYSGGFVYVDG